MANWQCRFWIETLEAWRHWIEWINSVLCARAHAEQTARSVCEQQGAEQTRARARRMEGHTQRLWSLEAEEHEQMQTASPDWQYMQMQRMKSSEKRLWREGIQFSPRMHVNWVCCITLLACHFHRRLAQLLLQNPQATTTGQTGHDRSWLVEVLVQQYSTRNKSRHNAYMYI